MSKPKNITPEQEAARKAKNAQRALAKSRKSGVNPRMSYFADLARKKEERLNSFRSMNIDWTVGTIELSKILGMSVTATCKLRRDIAPETLGVLRSPRKRLEKCPKCGSTERVKNGKSVRCKQCSESLRKEWIHKNIDRLRPIFAESRRVERINLSETYIASLLQIPTKTLQSYPDLIEAKRYQVKVLRELDTFRTRKRKTKYNAPESK